MNQPNLHKILQNTSSFLQMVYCLLAFTFQSFIQFNQTPLHFQFTEIF